MNLIFGDKYKLMKRDPGWELYKWYPETKVKAGKYKGNVTAAGFKPMRPPLYPHDLRHAISIMAEDYMTDATGDFSAKEGLRLVNKFIKELDVVKEGIA